MSTVRDVKLDAAAILCLTATLISSPAAAQDSEPPVTEGPIGALGATGQIDAFNDIWFTAFDQVSQTANPSGPAITSDLPLSRHRLNLINRAANNVSGTLDGVSADGRAEVQYSADGGFADTNTLSRDMVSAKSVVSFTAPGFALVTVTMNGTLSHTTGATNNQEGWARWRLDGIEIQRASSQPGDSARPYELTLSVPVTAGAHVLELEVYARLDFHHASDRGNSPQRIATTYVGAVSFGPYVPTNQPPVATMGRWGTRRGLAINVGLAAADPEGAALTYRVVTPPARGTLEGTGAARRYRPSPGFTGTDSFTFAASDGALESSPATVSIRVEAPPATGVPTTRIYASDGEPAPGLDGVFIQEPTRAVLNGEGRAAFSTGLTGAGTGSTNNSAIFVGYPGHLQLLARMGDAIPGGALGLRFGDLRFPTFAINAAGEVAFLTSIAGSNNDARAVFAGLPGALRTVVRGGDPAPGTSGAFSTFFQLFGFTDDGRAVILSSVEDPSGFLQGIWIGRSPETMTLVARTGVQIPGLEAGAMFGSFQGVSAGPDGTLAFTSFLQGVSSGNQSLWRRTAAGALQLVARSGDPVAGRPGSTISSFGGGGPLGGAMSVSPSGRLAFMPFLNTPAGFGQAIMTLGPGGLEVIAVRGDSAPGGGTYEGLQSPTINDRGQVAFAGSSGGQQRAYAGVAGSLRVLASTPDAVPDVPGGTFRGFNQPFIDEAGELHLRGLFDLAAGEGLLATFEGTLRTLVYRGQSYATAAGARQVDSPSIPGVGTNAPVGAGMAGFNALGQNVLQVRWLAGLGQAIVLAELSGGGPVVVDPCAPDGDAPSVSCLPSATVECGSPGSAVSATASDACGTPALSSDAPARFTAGTAVRFTATDAASNSASCTTQVAVVDTTPPVISCSASPVTLECGTPGSAISASASDACGAAPVTGAPPARFTADTSVTFTARDSAGLASSCTVDVAVIDTFAPALTCPPPIALECAGATTRFTPPVADLADVCDGARAVSLGEVALPAGASVLTYRAADAAGNPGSCTTDVLIRDTTPPSITCGDAVSVLCAPAAGVPADRVSLPAPSVRDICDPAPAVATSGARAVYPVGTTPVVFTARDAAGGSASCATEVRVAAAPATAITERRVSFDPRGGWETVDLADCIAAVRDPCSALTPAEVARNSRIVRFGADEPAARGKTCDLVLLSDHGFKVRAESDGGRNANGRVYTVEYAYTNPAGLVTEARCQVAVPRRRGEAAIDDGFAAGWVKSASEPGNCNQACMPEVELTVASWEPRGASAPAAPRVFAGGVELARAGGVYPLPLKDGDGAYLEDERARVPAGAIVLQRDGDGRVTVTLHGGLRGSDRVSAELVAEIVDGVTARVRGRGLERSRRGGDSLTVDGEVATLRATVGSGDDGMRLTVGCTLRSCDRP